MRRRNNTATQKRYYWLKLQDGFFNSKRIKKLRRLAGGDTYTIIYLKMQLLAMKTDGILRWTGLENDFASELALDLDEDAENVAVTMQYLLAHGLAETDDNTAFFFPYAVENTGSETSAAKRMRDMRERNNVTPALRSCYGEIEKEIDIEIEKEIDSVKAAKPRTRKQFTPPTLEEVKAYCKQRNSNVDPQKFFDYFDAGHWIDSEGKPVTSWKQKLITWEGRERNGKPVSGNAQKSTKRFNIHYDNE